MQHMGTYFNFQSLLVVAGLALVGGGIFFFHNGEDSLNTFVVTRGSVIEEVSVSGRVVAVDEVSLSFVGGGRVEGMYARVGDRVERGRVLAEIENDTIRALILQRRATLSVEEANLLILKEGTRPEEIAISEAAVTSAEVAWRQAEQSLVEKIKDAFRVADDATRVRADQFISNPRTSPQLSFNSSNTQAKVATENQRAGLEGVLNEWEQEIFHLTTQNDVPLALTRAKERLSAVALFLSHAHAAITQGIPSGSVSSATLEAYASDIAGARASVNAAITALTTAETAKKSARASYENAEKTLTLKKAGATDATIRAQEARVDAARASVVDAEAQLEKTFITAPFSGVVTVVEARAGESVAPNIPLLTIISDNALHIESFVPEINVALIQEGNEAVVTLDAYGESVMFPARVASIDPAETIRDGVSTYRALIEFVDDDPRVRAGMTATVVVTTARKEGVIAIPRAYLNSENGRPFVRVLTERGVEERPVSVGLASSFGNIEILSGIEEGEVVVP